LEEKKRKSGIQRENIMEAAAWLFKRKSFIRTSLDEVASRAGIKKATIFYYFPSKEHLLYEVLCECSRRGLQRHRSAYDPSVSPRENLEKVIKGHLKFNLHDGFGGISIFEQKNLSPVYVSPTQNCAMNTSSSLWTSCKKQCPPVRSNMVMFDCRLASSWVL